MLLCFALVAHEEDHVKPEISDTLALRNSRHPILEKVSSTPVVPNDCYVDDSVRFQIVTGPNMSGKSIYLNQIAIILVMAQLGCYVPCDYASIKISTKLLTRIGHDDGRHAEMSSFTEEMRDAMFILQQCNDSSMVIIDELGRGTSTTDGIALTIAVSEEVLKTKSFVLLATHFSEVKLVMSFIATLM
jgi:DNA mismatch repair protein MSH4